MRAHLLHAQALQIAHGGRQSHRVGRVGRARFELVRQHVPGAVGVAHPFDHVAAELIRRHRLQQLPPSHQHADAHRSEQLVAAERVEVDVERVEVDGQVRHRLGPVHHDHRRRTSPDDSYHVLQWRNRTHRVRHMRDRHDLGACADHVAQHVEIDGLCGRELHDAQRGTGAQRELLPRNEVRVVFERRHHDLVARTNVRTAPARRHQVHRLGGAAREDQTVGIGHAHESRDGRAGLVVRIGGQYRQRVRAAVRIGVRRFVEVTQRVEHRCRLLRRRCRVEVVQPRVGGKQREISAGRQW